MGFAKPCLPGVLSCSLTIVSGLCLLLVAGCLGGSEKTAAIAEAPATAPGIPVMPEPAIVRGTVTYRERIAMHPSARIVVTLEEESGADAGRETVAEIVLRQPGQVPVEFELTVPGEKIRADGKYYLSAVIIVDEIALFASPRETEIHLAGADSLNVELILFQPARERPEATGKE